MNQATLVPHPPDNVNSEANQRTAIGYVLKRLYGMNLPAKEHLENYMRHKWRVNHKPRTIENSFTSVRLFL